MLFWEVQGRVVQLRTTDELRAVELRLVASSVRAAAASMPPTPAPPRRLAAANDARPLNCIATATAGSWKALTTWICVTRLLRTCQTLLLLTSLPILSD